MAMDPDLYLKKHCVLTYIEDGVSSLLERKDEDPKIKPFELLTEYFSSIKARTHILFREYSYVCATAHNRISFVSLFWKSYTEIAKRNERMKVSEYLPLLRLHCYDFPVSVVFKVAQVMFTHSPMDNLISFTDFLFTFQTVFYYEYFLGLCEGLYRDILSGRTTHSYLGGSTVFVSMPSAAEQESESQPAISNSPYASGNLNEAQMNDMSETVLGSKQVECEIFMTAVIKLIHKLREDEPWESCPNVDNICEVIGQVRLFTFFDFVRLLSKNEAINTDIGVLPSREKLLSK